LKANTIAVHPDRHPDMACVVIGLGLLGSAIASSLNRCVAHSTGPTEKIHLDWNSLDSESSDLLHLLRRGNARHVEIIWCAGQAGFLSENNALEREYRLFEHTVSALKREFGEGLSVNLLSSAGGLYEGTGFVRHINEVSTARPYGDWKLRQELFLAESETKSRIFRLSSAYGPLQSDQRTGLLNMLMERALDGGVAEVYASPATLRDYVFTGDVARYVVDSIIGQRDPGTQLLASGRPTSVDGLIKIISSVTRRRVRVQYRNHRENASDIVFSRHLPPGDFIISPLEETVRLLAACRLGVGESGV
jgi:nucleoside-diphosphate-sugar epimerase